MPDIIDTVQLQSIDDSLVELFEITLPDSSNVDIRLVSGLAEGSSNIYFPSLDGTSLHEYVALPASIENIEIDSSGAANRPMFQIANLISLGRAIENDGDGVDDEETWQQVLQNNSIDIPEDILGSRLTYRKTLLKNTYKVADLSGWSTTLPVEFPKSTFIMDRIKGENSVFVSYELSSPFDLERLKLPSRIIIGKYCTWKYQGIAIDGDQRSGCTYPTSDSAQPKFFDIEDEELTGITSGYVSGQSYSTGTLIKYPTSGFVKIWEALANPSGVTAPPTEGSRYWKRVDICGKTLKSCKVRFQGVDTNGDPVNRAVLLPFGAFPGTRKFK